MRNHSFMLFMIVVSTAFFSSSAFAQSSDPARAQQHFEDGAALYTQGDYSKAIVEFLKGHAIAPNAMFLYNISLSYLKLENVPDALDAAEEAKTFEGMPAKVSLRNDARIASFRSVLSANDVAEEIAQAAEASVEEPMAERPVDDEGGIGGLGWTGVGLGVVGTGLVVGALLVNLGVSSDIDALEAEAAGGDPDRFDTLKNDIESGQSTGKVLLYSGAGLAATGIILLFVDLATGSESDASMGLAPTEGGARAEWSIRF